MKKQALSCLANNQIFYMNMTLHVTKNYEVVNTVLIIAPIKLMPKHLYFVAIFQV